MNDLDECSGNPYTCECSRCTDGPGDDDWIDRGYQRQAEGKVARREERDGTLTRRNEGREF